jgi:predicted MFS family arabinose efflux permease
LIDEHEVAADGPPDRWRRQTVAALAGAYFVVSVNNTIMPAVAAFLEKEFQLTALGLTAVLAMFPAVAFVSNIVLGPLIDMFGRRTFIICGLICCTAIFLVTAAARDAAMLVAMRAVTGLFMPMIGAAIFAGVADYFPAAERNRVNGYVASASSLAQLTAIPAGLLIGTFVSWRAVFLAMSFLCVATLALLVPLPRPRFEVLDSVRLSARIHRERLLAATGRPGVRPVLLSYFMALTAIACVITLYPTWLLHLLSEGEVAGAALVLVAGGVGGLAGSLSAAKVLDSSRTANTAIFHVALAAGLAALVLPWPWRFIEAHLGGYAVFCAGRMMIMVMLVSIALKLVRPTERASLNGVLNAVYQAATATGAALAVLVYAGPGFIADVILATVLFAAVGATARFSAPGRAAERPGTASLARD